MFSNADGRKKKAAHEKGVNRETQQTKGGVQEDREGHATRGPLSRRERAEGVMVWGSKREY